MDSYPLAPVTGPCRLASLVHTVVTSTRLHHMSPNVHVLHSIDIYYTETVETMEH